MASGPKAIPTLESRIRGALYALAVTDALGAPVEFRQRGTFPLVTSMIPNTNFKIYDETTQQDVPIPPGSFTDDTSMALCLAHSLLDCNAQHDSIDQVRKYLAWFKYGYLSSVNECFDIGNATSSALNQWSSLLKSYDSFLSSSDQDETSPEAIIMRTEMQDQVSSRFNTDSCCGNGSLMRVLPCALISSSLDHVTSLAAESSKPTHPHKLCIDACILYTTLIFHALQGSSKAALHSTLLSLLTSSSMHPSLTHRLSPYTTLSTWTLTPSLQIKSTGFVLDTLEAALWSFFSTDTYAEGAIRAVNLGDDADTVGAVYGGLAGAFYGNEQIPEEWVRDMNRRGMEMVEETVRGF